MKLCDKSDLILRFSTTPDSCYRVPEVMSAIQGQLNKSIIMQFSLSFVCLIYILKQIENIVVAITVQVIFHAIHRNSS